MAPTVEGTPIRKGRSYFLSPTNARQRRYEAPWAYLVEGLSRDQTAARFGYTPAAMALSISPR